MNKDQIVGRAKEVKGAVKEGLGKVTGNASLQAKGKAEQAAGAVQATYGDGKEKVSKAVKSLTD